MRNPERIPVILERLRTLWEAHPDLRLGQLVDDLSWVSGASACPSFYMEDDELLDRIDLWNSSSRSRATIRETRP